MPHGSAAANGRTWTREEENRLAEWLTTQRLLFECGKLEPWKAEHLSEQLGTWYREPTERELNNAFYSENTEPNDAFAVWFNHHHLAPGELTFAEIRVFAEQEVRLER